MTKAPPLLTLKDARMAYGPAPLFDGLNLSINAGDRIGLIGKNGAGKSTLLSALAGGIELDSGEIFLQPGRKVGLLQQTPKLDTDETVFEFCARSEAPKHRIEGLIDRVDLEPDRLVRTLSGGESRRAALARALAFEPDVLLLDEPTNHLDLPTIEWLETEIARMQAGIVLVSHDRAFLRSVTKSTVWIRRGVAVRTERGYAHFQRWQEELQRQDETEWIRLEQQLAEEVRYQQRGVTARRRRNQRRVEKLATLRKERAKRLSGRRTMNIGKLEAAHSGNLVMEIRDLEFAYDETPMVSGFSTRIMRGDRIGIVGPNGAGKTTFVKLLLGTLEQQSGRIRRAKELDVAYFDQHRDALNPKSTLREVLAPHGGDRIDVRGTPKHVLSYLQDFLFEAQQSVSLVEHLSGGERNRLLLAKLLMKPAALVVLDEPTNDLDIDTLELLEDLLGAFDGTLLIVSHDREFLDNLVTSVIAVEGNGEVVEYAGGYTDYRTQKSHRRELTAEVVGERTAPAEPPKPKKINKLSYMEQRELDALPGDLEAAEAKVNELQALIDDPDFYPRDPEGFNQAVGDLEAAKARHETLEERWLELEMKAEELAQ